MDQTNAAATAAGTEQGAAPGVSESNMDDQLHQDFLQDQTADAEVLPRAWDVTDGGAVYDGRYGEGNNGHNDGSSPHGRRNRQNSRGNGAGGGGRAGARRQRRAGRRQEETDENASKRVKPSKAEGRNRPESSRDKLRWREITKQPFDLLLLVDTGDALGSARTLLSMPEYGVEEQERAEREGHKPGGIYICPTVAEYYMLLSVYFGEYIDVMLPEYSDACDEGFPELCWYWNEVGTVSFVFIRVDDTSNRGDFPQELRPGIRFVWRDAAVEQQHRLHVGRRFSRGGSLTPRDAPSRPV